MLKLNVHLITPSVKYYWLLGGAALMTAEVFRALNGYSNRYFGWGGEDDDFKSRSLNVYNQTPNLKC